MANPSKTKLIEHAKTLGLKVGDDWTHRQIKDAIAIAETEDDIAQEDTNEALGEIGMTSEPDPVETEPLTFTDGDTLTVSPVISEPPASEPVTVKPPLVAPEPTPTVPALPSTPIAAPIDRTVPEYNPSQPRIGAGKYHVLWTVTLPGGPVNSGIVDLSDAQAISLVKQGAVVHVDDYQAYLKHNAGKQPVKRQTHPTSVPVGAGRYRTVGGVMRNGKEIPHGTVAEFSDSEVTSLTKPGMIAIEFAD